MKQIKYYLFATMMVLSCGMFTSCDNDDVHEAMTLSGEWYGDFCMNYTDRYGRTYHCSDTNLKFYQNSPYSRYGWGQQVDFYYYDRYSRVPFMRQYFKFEWSISNGVIRLRYPYDHQLDVNIYDYHLSNRYFDGYLDDGYERSFFRLDKLVDFRWSDYDRYGNYDIWWNTDIYYAKKNNIFGDAKKDTTTNINGKEMPMIIEGDSIQSQGRTWRKL